MMGAADYLAMMLASGSPFVGISRGLLTKDLEQLLYELGYVLDKKMSSGDDLCFRRVDKKAPLS